MKWQAQRYMAEVNDHRWYMSQRNDHGIDWREAEQDFIRKDYCNCAEKWRETYCLHICPFSKNCLFAAQMLNNLEEGELRKAG